MDNSSETLDTYMSKVRRYMDVEYPEVCRVMMATAECALNGNEVTINETGEQLACLLYYGFVKCDTIPETAGTIAKLFRDMEVIGEEGSDEG